MEMMLRGPRPCSVLISLLSLVFLNPANIQGRDVFRSSEPEQFYSRWSGPRSFQMDRRTSLSDEATEPESRRRVERKEILHDKLTPTNYRRNYRKPQEMQSKMMDEELSDIQLSDLQSFESAESEEDKSELQSLLANLRGQSFADFGDQSLDEGRGRRGRRRKLSSHEQGLLLVETLRKKRNYTDMEDHRGHGTHLHSGIMDMLGRSMSSKHQ